MKSLILISIFVAAVKAREVVQYDQGKLIENDVGQHGYGEKLLIGCDNTLKPSTSQVTLTTTMIWLNSITVSSLVLSSTSYTVFITTTEYSTTIGTGYEAPCTFTAVPAIHVAWTKVTETKTEVVEKTFWNLVPVTETSTIKAEAIEVSVKCGTRLVDGDTNYITRTTYWTHTQTLHDKVMVGTDIEVTVTSTHLESNIEAQRFTEYITRTETATRTIFDTTTHNTASTLTVTHAVKTVCL